MNQQSTGVRGSRRALQLNARPTPQRRQSTQSADCTFHERVQAMTKHRIRRHLAHGVQWDDNRRPILFVTVCTQRRAPVLANSTLHDLLTDVWRDANAWLVGRYVIMPDHLHFFTAPRDEAFSLEVWMQYWKSQLGKRQHTNSDFKRVRWQRDHWDTRLRNLETYAEKWDYVRYNPVRKGLVASADEWPYQGTLNELRCD